MTTRPTQQSKTLVVTPIPCPGEDYDAPHTTVASLASLRAMAESYDSIMDSIMNSTNDRMNKLESISRRAERCRTLAEYMKKIGDYGGAVTVSAPSSYERAITGGNKKKHDNKDDGDISATKDLNDALSSLTSETISAIDQARLVSNASVLNALRHDSMKDDGLARPSDLWLDRASGFDEHRACRNAERANSVPLLGRVYYRYRGDYYTMDDDEAAANAAGAATTKNSTGAPDGSVVGGSRRDHKKEQGPHIRRMENHDLHKTTFSGATSRQQAASGSTPYLCEVLHDAYGMGTVPPAGGEFYPEPTDVGELLVFNSSRKTYGGGMLYTSTGGGRGTAETKKEDGATAAANEKEEEEVDLIDLSGVNEKQAINRTTTTTDDKSKQNSIDLLGGNSPIKDNNNDVDDKILSSDFSHPRSKMLLQVPSYRPEAPTLNAGKLELPTDLPLNDVARVSDDANALDAAKGVERNAKLENAGEFV